MTDWKEESVLTMIAQVGCGQRSLSRPPRSLVLDHMHDQDIPQSQHLGISSPPSSHTLEPKSTSHTIVASFVNGGTQTTGSLNMEGSLTGSQLGSQLSLLSKSSSVGMRAAPFVFGIDFGTTYVSCNQIPCKIAGLPSVMPSILTWPP